MSEFRLSPEAEGELDGIWIRIARESGSSDIATRVVERITGRFWLLARYPYMGRRRDDDLRPGLRSLASDEYVIIHSIAEEDVVLILHVVHGSRDLVALFGR
jgi:plasmid stabilization system protein ParE